MKIFFAVYLILIAGVLSLAFLVPSGRKEAVANVDRPTAAANVSTFSSTTASSLAKKANTAKQVAPKASSTPPQATSTPLQPAQETTSSTTPTTTSQSSEPEQPTPQPSLSFGEEVEQEIHILVNAARAENGLEPLVWDSALTVLAREHSTDMQSNNYFAHDNLLGCSSSCRISAAGYLWKNLGENIYTMNGFSVSSKEAAQMVVEGWLKSPGHRANILSTIYTNQGVGVTVVGKTLYATEDFAKPR